MYVINIITLLLAVIEMISSDRLSPLSLRPGESRLSLNKNMFITGKETKEAMENYLYNNAPYRKYNQAVMDKAKRTKDDLDQYFYEKYNDVRKSNNLDTSLAKEDLKNLYNNAPFRKSLQQFRSLPVYYVILKKDNERDFDEADESSDDDNRLRKNKNNIVLRTGDNARYSDDSDDSSDDDNRLRKKQNKLFLRKGVNNIITLKKDDFARESDESSVETSDDDNRYLKKEDEMVLRRVDNVEDIKKLLRLGKEDELQCVAVKTRRVHINYDSTSSSTSKEFHSGEKRQFKLWREHYVCGGAVMPKYEPPADDQALRPTKYKSTNRLLNEMLQEKKWRPGNPVKRLLPVKAVTKGRIRPLRRKTDGNQFLVPPRTEFELSELVI